MSEQTEFIKDLLDTAKHLGIETANKSISELMVAIKAKMPAMDNAHRPAHPTNGRMHPDAFGLTKREYFAALAMQGLCANSIPGNHHMPVELSREAIEYADELLKQLNK